MSDRNTEMQLSGRNLVQECGDMTACVVTVYARGGVRTLAEITVGLANRRVALKALSSSFDGSMWRVDLTVDVPTERATDLLVNRLNRIVNVTKVVVQRDPEGHGRPTLPATVVSR